MGKAKSGILSGVYPVRNSISPRDISNGVFIDKTAIVAKTAKIGRGTKVWAFAQIGERAVIGKNCVIGNGAYIDRDVVIGDNVKIHNKALLYRGLIVEDDCFIGPGACFTNDKRPRHDKTRSLCGISWRLKQGASIGANATILPDVDIGKNAVIGAGSVVTASIPDGALACGNPARIRKRKPKPSVILRSDERSESRRRIYDAV